MKYRDNINQVVQLNPDYLGFIFYEKSSRYMGSELSSEVVKKINPMIKKIGVFVNATQEHIMNMTSEFDLDLIQLHGTEKPKLCLSLKQKGLCIIKAFQIDDSFDFETLLDYEEYVDYFLFDTKSKAFGGTGKKFNWELLQNYHSKKPFFLSGGISLEDASEISENKLIRTLNIEALDINSRFETEPGRKNPKLISEFIKNLSHEI